MRLIVGLGNPGESYARTRHNVGFMITDSIADHYAFPRWREKRGALITEGLMAGRKVLMIKPQSWMNKSGWPVAETMNYRNISPDEVLIIHDEIDLAVGKIRVKCGGGDGGHNGLKDISRHISNDYWRLRVGVGRPKHGEDVDRHVLANFDQQDKQWLAPLITAITLSLTTLVDGEHEEFMTHIAQEAPPPQHDQESSNGI